MSKKDEHTDDSTRRVTFTISDEAKARLKKYGKPNGLTQNELLDEIILAADFSSDSKLSDAIKRRAAEVAKTKVRKGDLLNRLRNMETSELAKLLDQAEKH